MKNADRRGRKPTFDQTQRQQLAEMIRQHGIDGTKAICGFPICQSTLGKIAREFSIPLKTGRRRRRFSMKTSVGTIEVIANTGNQPEQVLREALTALGIAKAA